MCGGKKLNKWVNKLQDILPKFYLDKVLLVIRALTILIWVMAMWMSVEIKIEIQVCFVTIIFLSDALDGIISRRFTVPRQQYQFRIMDAAVDKFGILFFLGTLFCLGRINMSSLFIILGYNIFLVVFPFIYILGNSSKKVDWIQATIWSRIYAISVGLFCFAATISDVALRYCSWWALYFIVLGIMSFVSHLNKMKRIKGEL